MTSECAITVSSPADLVAVTPYVLGFHPTDSVVVIGVADRQVVFGARCDLPPPGHDPKELARTLADLPLETVIVLGYGPARAVTPAVLRLVRALNFADVRVGEVIRVTDGRWWSYLCRDPGCCPVEGRPCQPPDGLVAAQAVFQGKVALPNRQALVAQVAAVEGAERAAMVRATERARERLTDLSADDLRSGRAGRWVRRAGRAAVREAEGRARGGASLTPDETAWLGVLLVDPAVLGYALDRSGREEWRIRLWTEMLRRMQPAYVPGPACLLGYTAWQAGEGPLARVAVDRALIAEPGHRAAVLLDDVLCAGFAPTAVARIAPRPADGDVRFRRRSA